MSSIYSSALEVATAGRGANCALRFSTTMNGIPSRITEIHHDMQEWNYGESVAMSECGVEDFIAWYQWRKELTKNPGASDEIGIEEFDVESAVEIMAGWIKKPLEA